MEPANARTYVVISGVIFGLVAVIHLLRAVNGWTFELGPVSVPVGAVLAWVRSHCSLVCLGDSPR